MKLLVISNILPPTVFGGYESAAADIIRAATARGWVVESITSNWAPNTNEVPVHANRTLNMNFSHESPIGIPHNDRNAVVIGNAQDIHQHIARFQPDRILLMNLAGLGIASVLAPVIASGVPTLAYVMDSWPTLRLDRMFAGGDWLLEPLLRFAPITWISCSRTIADEVRVASAGTVQPDRIIPAWIDAKIVPDVDECGEQTSFAFVSSLSIQKGADLALEAFIRHSRKHPTAEYHFYGDGPLRTSLQERAKESTIRNITFHGWVPREHVRSRLSLHTALVFPTSKREPFGFVTLEGMMAGLPVITTLNGGTESFPRDTFIQCKRETSSIFDSMMRVSSDRNRAQAIGRRAREYVLANFTSKPIDDLLETTASLPAEKPPSRSLEFATTLEMLTEWVDSPTAESLPSRAIRGLARAYGKLPNSAKRRLEPLKVRLYGAIRT